VGRRAALWGGLLTLRVRCPAKVNLHLQVMGRRPDGFHELRTLFAAIGVWDDVELEEGPPGVVEVSTTPAGSVAGGRDNLVWRAADLLRRRRAPHQGARVRLTKRIPVAAGMGGGSSDAAGTLVGLDSLWGAEAPADDLAAMAATLGSDVPFFLCGGVAWGVGRGTEVTPLPDLPSYWFVVLAGETGVSTAEVYARVNAQKVDEDAVSAVYESIVKHGDVPLDACRNDLEQTVLEGWPDVRRRLDEVRSTTPLLARVSGSGGAVFGLYASEQAARVAGQALASARPLVAPLLTRRQSRPRPLPLEDRWKSPRFGST
jgi:4-diphosphocytidyl-2-C-methyl-D-erythritol kinase